MVKGLNVGRRNISEFRVLIVPGLHGSDPEHWQSRWQRLYPSFERVEQADWETPDLSAWSARLEQALCCSSRPALVVAHSFGCLATVHAASRGVPNVAAALLVAPADPGKFGLSGPLSVCPLTKSSLVVGSRNDPWMASQQAEFWAKMWGANFLCAGDLGHINTASGIGDWSFGLSLLQDMELNVEGLYL
jgi:predicted alpha/beta hydrolase family esterase